MPGGVHDMQKLSARFCERRVKSNKNVTEKGFDMTVPFASNSFLMKASKKDVEWPAGRAWQAAEGSGRDGKKLVPTSPRHKWRFEIVLEYFRHFILFDSH
jgi:hypothetical protein